MSTEALAAFGRLVVDDDALRRELLAAADRCRFVELVVQRAADHGWDVSASDVEEGLRAARQAWQERWI